MVKELRKLCEEVETIKAEREVIENEIKEAKFDMSKSVRYLRSLTHNIAQCNQTVKIYMN